MKLDSNKIGIAIMTVLFLLLAYAGYLSQKSIDWDVLKKLESQTLVLPTQIPSPIISPTASPVPTK